MSCLPYLFTPGGSAPRCCPGEHRRCSPFVAPWRPDASPLSVLRGPVLRTARERLPTRALQSSVLPRLLQPCKSLARCAAARLAGVRRANGRGAPTERSIQGTACSAQTRTYSTSSSSFRTPITRSPAMQAGRKPAGRTAVPDANRSGRRGPGPKAPVRPSETPPPTPAALLNRQDRNAEVSVGDSTLT